MGGEGRKRDAYLLLTNTGEMQNPELEVLVANFEKDKEKLLLIKPM